MIFFKSCARCAGDRTLELDNYGWYIICLCCGYVTYPDIAKDAQEAGDDNRSGVVGVTVSKATDQQDVTAG